MVTGRVTPPGRSPKSSTASDRRAGDDPAAVETAPPPASPHAEDLPELHAGVQRSLPGMRPATASALAASGRIRPFRAGDILFRQEEPIPLTLMIRGYGGFRRTTVEGKEVTVGLAEPGQIYGITNASGTIASVELFALTEGAAVQWRGSTFRKALLTDPKLAIDVVDRLAAFLTILTGKVDGFLHQDARRRVIRVLARHRDLFFSDPPVLSRAHLPGLVGTSREMTGRVIRDLERDGVVARVGRTGLRLLDATPLDEEPSSAP
jgi:CRP-like cAMP-binding protein